ncbi:MAG: bifunctional riboflavin kinase/FAD synthetase [Legionella sp.]|nr:bifunctional riboflavin kinase/FAD synthetase [Legionella sp.]
MKLLRHLPHLTDFENGVVATVGNFDGVHLGHQKLIKALRIQANILKLPLVLILFEPLPKEYFKKATARLSSLREKLAILKNCQVDYVYCIKFNDVFAQTTALEFVNTYLFSNLKVKYLLVGRDFRFGKNREGSIELLQEMGLKHGCDVQLAADFSIGDEKVSSTKIRHVLEQGQLNVAALYLGRPYSMCGRVIYGDGRGRQWGVPTANLSFNRTSLPLEGVFAVEVQLNSSKFHGVANIGRRPTVDGTKNSLEVHLFDFDASIYGELLQVVFLHKLRKEVKFTSLNALIEQIHKDIALAKRYFLDY